MTTMQGYHMFHHDEVKSLLKDKYIVIIGDSIYRGVYKDLVVFLQRNRLLREADLRAKGEESFEGDNLVWGGVKQGLHNNADYREERYFQTEDTDLRFLYITRIYSPYMSKLITELQKHPPDVLLVSSVLWDTTRYGSQSIREFPENLDRFLKKAPELLGPSCEIVWLTTPPISKDCYGGVVGGDSAALAARKGISSSSQARPFHVEEAIRSGMRQMIRLSNVMASDHVKKSKLHVLDVHYFILDQLHLRARDGIHWSAVATRKMTNVILTFLQKLFSSSSSTTPSPTLNVHPELERCLKELRISRKRYRDDENVEDARAKRARI